MKIISKLLSYSIIYLLKIINFIYKKKGILFSNLIVDEIEANSYLEKIINNTKINFFCPNGIIEWRINTLLTKEPKTIEWINKFEGGNINFWDIGSNIGIFSIYAAIKHKNNIQVKSFEPSTSNLRVLTRNISINKLHNDINVVQMPLFDKDIEFQLMNESRFKEGSALHSFSVNYDYEGKEFLIKNKYNIIGTSIDFLIEKKILDYPDYVKIDVDGTEHLILDGAKKLLSSKNKPKEILVELHEKFETQFLKVFNLMQENHYHLIEEKKGQIEYIFKAK